ncbi:MAG: hypothetical protein WC449_04945 [Candidatus Paceibacterota bacterium]
MFEWKTKKQRWGSHASLMYDRKVLVEIEYTDNENYGVYSDCFSFLFANTPYGKSFVELIDYVQDTIKAFCKDYSEWENTKR